MTEAVDVCLSCSNFLEFLKSLAWCRQGDDTLIAVHRCTPEIVEALRVHEVRVFPGGMFVKVPKSWLSHLDERDRGGDPVPCLVAWKPDCVEIWYRRHKESDFPYDIWQDPAAAAYERERAKLPKEHFSGDYDGAHRQVLGRAKPCPSAIRLD